MKINVGVTVLIKDPKTDSMFNNGIKQNVVILQEIYEKCKNVNKAYIINADSSVTAESYKNTTWEKYSDRIITPDQAKEMCDLIVLCHGNVSMGMYAEYNRLGKKIVLQALGAQLSMFDECVIFDMPPKKIFKSNPYINAVWTSPHFYERDKHFYEALYDCPVYEAPYIWDPQFITHHVNLLKKSDPTRVLEYEVRSEQKRISVVEPNINMVKTATVPIIISELFFRKNPKGVDKVSIFGGKKFSKKQDMIDFATDLDIYKAKKLFFEERYPIVWTLSAHTDILLSHQSGCELNYAYLDAAWLGYPVVHNSPMMKDLGWYYPGNNATIALEHLEYIVRNFDSVEYPNNKYLEKSRKFASRYLMDNPENIAGYENLIEKVMTGDK